LLHETQQRQSPSQTPKRTLASAAQRKRMPSSNITVQAALEERDRGFSYPLTLLGYVGIGVAISLAFSLLLYGVIRAIGWVIGGFATS